MIQKNIFRFICFLFIFNFHISLSYAGFDHSHVKYQQILNEYVVQDGKMTWIKYKDIKANTAKLDSYLKDVEKVTLEEYMAFTESHQLSFLLNAYNAFTLKLISNYYPVESVKDIKSGGFFNRLFRRGPWKKKFFKLFGFDASLDDIEHGMLRPKFNEPRIHFAINCASISCPPLQKFVYLPEKIEEQLDFVTKSFLTDENNNRFTESELEISKVFDWFEEDFVKKFKTVENFIVSYMNLPKKDYSIDYMSYNWDLNDFHQRNK